MIPRAPRNGSWSRISGSPPSPARTACTCSSKSLASAEPLVGRRASAHRQEQRGARHQDDGRRRLCAFRARGSRAAAAAWRRRWSWPRDGKGDYGFLDSQLTAFDLTDRGVKGRLVQTALDAFLFTERGVYRSGETVFLTALLRDAKGAVVPGLPVTIVIQRPDGVEYKRVKLDDQGLGGRSLRAAAALGRAARHLAHPGLCRPEIGSHRRDELPSRGLCSPKARGDARARREGASGRRSRRASASMRASSTARRAPASM